MIKRIIGILPTILFLLIPLRATAQEVITSYDSRTISTLNEELRKSRENTTTVRERLDAMLPIDLTSSDEVDGALPISNGGTGSSDRATAFHNLAPDQSGHAGEVLITDGTTISFSSMSRGLNLVETETITSQTGSVSVEFTIDTSKNYTLVWKTYADSGPGNPPTHRFEQVTFNNDTNAKYSNGDTAANTDTSLTPTATRTVQHHAGRFNIEFLTSMDGSSSYTALLDGYIQSAGIDSGGGSGNSHYKEEIFGMFNNGSTDITTMELDFTTGGSELMSGTLLLYEITQ